MSDTVFDVATWPRLYKIGSMGQVLEWFIGVSDVNGNGVITIKHGQLDGTLTESHERVEEGKNLGKANETTPVDQAVSQAESRWKKQLDRAYRQTIEEAKKAAVASTKAMRAHKWDEKKHKLKVGEDVLLQAKLDGRRCLAKKEDGKVFLISNGGKPIESVPHIVAELEAFLPEGEVWDGELYNHNMEFETMGSICGRKAKNLHPQYASMEFHIFDSVSDDPFLGRFERVLDAITIPPNGPYRARVNKSSILVPVPCTPYQLTEDFEHTITEEYLPQYEACGYEGLMIRKLDMPYEHKRSLQLIKVKSFEDDEFKIVGTQSGKKGSRQEDLLIKFDLECTNSDGKVEIFEGTLMGTEKVRRDMLTRRDEYIGLLATAKYQEKTKYGVPRFAKVKGIRDKEDLCAD